MISYIKHRQIDKSRWDDAISRSQNGLVYALSWYLDIVSPGWEALIEGDYEYVMPLPVKRKFGIPYLVQPLFTQQLGVFSENLISESKVIEFLQRIPRKFLRVHINLNSHNPVPANKNISMGVNYELDLNKPISELYAGFNENTKRNIQNANSNNLILTEYSFEQFILYYEQYANPKPNKDEIRTLSKIISSSSINNYAQIIMVKQGSEFISGGCFLYFKSRLIYLASYTTKKGKEVSAMFLVFNYIIKKYSETGFILDFEGSRIEGIARFFKGFGANLKSYYHIRKTFPTLL